jgi:pimeloyl-ACP methyl ester carboxylesterase
LSSECQGVHHIFLVHGVGGNKQTFGHLEKILPLNIPCVTVENFEYKTGSVLTTYDFARDFDEFIKKKKLSGSISPKDNISLIMHSQGGIVGSLWLKLLADTNDELKTQLSSFITLATPFWGASTAQIAKIFFYSLPEGVPNPIAPFGRNELKEMSYGSETIYDLAENLDSVFQKFPQLKVLHIGGMKRLYGPMWGEDDVVVPTYSMQSRHYFYKDQINVTEPPSLVEIPFKREKERPFIIIPSDHVKLYQDGIADLPASCLKAKDCPHPLLKPLLDQLKGGTPSGKETTLTKFRVTIRVESLSKPIDRDEVSFRISEKQKVLGLRLIDVLEAPSTLGAKKSINYTYTGTFKSSQQDLLQMSLFFRNKRLKSYSMPIEAGVSSLLRIQLDGL